jgi:RND superfamily putative drug exporter
VDAFIVRTFLFPAILGLLGKWAWWSPRWLTRSARIEYS